MPNIKTDQERGYIGAWLRRERTRRDWSPEQVVERLAERGRRVRADYYRQLESGSGGKKPGPNLLLALVELFGSEPEPLPEPAEETGGDMAALVSALGSQTAELSSLNGSLQRLADLLEAQTNQDLRGLVATTIDQTLRTLADEGLLVAPPAQADARALVATK